MRNILNYVPLIYLQGSCSIMSPAVPQRQQLENSGCFLGGKTSSSLALLAEADVGGLLTEALTREVDTVLADEGVAGTSDAALARALTVTAGVRVPLSGVALLLHFRDTFDVGRKLQLALW